MLTCCETARPSSSRCREIEETAHRQLRESPYPAVRRVLCRFDRGTLVLRGNVPSFHHKQIAQEAVAGLGAEASVVNEIEVDA